MNLAKHAAVRPLAPASKPWASRAAFRARTGASRVQRAHSVFSVRAAVEEPGSPALPAPRKVLGFGGCGVDYLASVAQYPKPDAKLRTDTLEVQGGGNCGNALTAAARLGLSPVIGTKIGDDALGDGILKEFEDEGIDTTHVVRAEGASSPFTYIIVDRAGGTRTCIHTPSEPLTPEEVSQQAIQSMLEGVELVYFDGRLTEAAIPVAKAARAAGIPVLVELERLRPNLEALAAEADYIVTSAHFPSDWTGTEVLGDAMIATLARLPNAKHMVTTLGTRGSVMLTRSTKDAGDASAVDAVLEDLLKELFKEVNTYMSPRKNGESCDCETSNGGAVHAGQVVSYRKEYRILPKSSVVGEAAELSASAAAVSEAAANADGSNAAAYAAAGAIETPKDLRVNITVAAAASLSGVPVADTTGAGDSFIGSILYGIVTDLSPEETLRLGGVVAACKCSGLGARPALPKRESLSAKLL